VVGTSASAARVAASATMSILELYQYICYITDRDYI